MDVKPRNQHSTTSATQGGEQQPQCWAALYTEGLRIPGAVISHKHWTAWAILMKLTVNVH